jgi:fluoroacetyl-CoA thioesterase
MEEITDQRRASRSQVVGEGDTAAAFGPDFPRAAATPWVLGLAEVTCHDAIAATLEHGSITVGVSASVEHMAPTPVGATVTAVAELVEQRGRRYTFDVELHDGVEVCARIRHVRAAVLPTVIEERLEAKASQAAAAGGDR